MRNSSKQLPQRLLGSVLEFMALAGVSETSTRSAFEKAFSRAQVLRSQRQRSGMAKLRLRGDASAYLLRLWHRDARYLSNDDFNPKPLPISGGRTNLRSLIRRIDPDANPTEILNEMISVGLIKETGEGRYLPTGKAAVFSTLHPWAIEHAAHSVMRLLSTVCRNASADAGPRLLERYSYVPDLDPKEAQAFADFSRKQGQVLLDILDDWLEQHRVVGKLGNLKRQQGISAGIHLITFVADEDRLGAASKIRKSRRKQKSTPPNPLPATPS